MPGGLCQSGSQKPEEDVALVDKRTSTSVLSIAIARRSGSVVFRTSKGDIIRNTDQVLEAGQVSLRGPRWVGTILCRGHFLVSRVNGQSHMVSVTLAAQHGESDGARIGRSAGGPELKTFHQDTSMLL